jgi:hypothetical protein
MNKLVTICRTLFVASTFTASTQHRDCLDIFVPYSPIWFLSGFVGSQ